MFKYDGYIEEEMDACDVCEEQTRYVVALALSRACTQIGK